MKSERVITACLMTYHFGPGQTRPKYNLKIFTVCRFNYRRATVIIAINGSQWRVIHRLGNLIELTLVIRDRSWHFALESQK